MPTTIDLNNAIINNSTLDDIRNNLFDLKKQIDECNTFILNYQSYISNMNDKKTSIQTEYDLLMTTFSNTQLTVLNAVV